MTTTEKKIEEYCTPALTELGYSIIRIKIFKAGKHTTLQLMIERADGNSVGLQDCEKVSREVSVLLDVLDPIKGHYSLEVSSAGIDRPLTKVSDYKRFVGKDIIVKTYASKAGYRLFKGVLEYADERLIRISLKKPLDTGEFQLELAYDEISDAQLDSCIKY